MLQFLRSSIRFVFRVIKRAMAGIIWWLLDVSELYSKVIAPSLPSEWAAWLEPYAVWLNVATPWVVAAIVIGAILYTYYEIDKELLRNPKVTKKLREFYNASGDLLRRQVSNVRELEELKRDTEVYYKELSSFVKENMADATVARLYYRPHSLPYNHGNAKVSGHQEWINGIHIVHKNLQAIIDSQEWR